MKALILLLLAVISVMAMAMPPIQELTVDIVNRDNRRQHRFYPGESFFVKLRWHSGQKHADNDEFRIEVSGEGISGYGSNIKHRNQPGTQFHICPVSIDAVKPGNYTITVSLTCQGASLTRQTTFELARPPLRASDFSLRIRGPQVIEQRQNTDYRLEITNRSTEKRPLRLRVLLAKGLSYRNTTESVVLRWDFLLDPHKKAAFAYQILAEKCGRYRQRIQLSSGERLLKNRTLWINVHDGSYGIPADVWRQCRFRHQGKAMLDMSSHYWRQLPLSRQQQYARDYQKNYARLLNEPVEKTFAISGANFVMRLIPPGRFLMGSAPGELGRAVDEILHEVIITSPFWIGKFEITQEQWRMIMGNAPAHFQRKKVAASAELPVEQVSWEECRIFCSYTQFELPTEAQWEYACRAGSTMPFNPGENISAASINYNGRYSYYDRKTETNRRKTVVAGSLNNANAWGCYDFHGNVYEWCADWYGEYHPQMSFDPEGPASGFFKVIRGGCWFSRAYHCRSAMRYRDMRSYRASGVGLRGN